MNDQRTKKKPTENLFEAAPQCGPGCHCSATGRASRRKLIIFCLVMVTAAAVALSHGLTLKAQAQIAQGQKGFAAMASATEKTGPWDVPLNNLAALDTIAAGKNVVFLYLPAKGRRPAESVEEQIENAASKAESSRGLKAAFYSLDTGSQDYSRLTGKTPAPCVLVLVRGAGMSPVTGNISEGKLLQAVVVASRASVKCGCAGKCNK
ncbi:MAG: hypothetical protein P4L55_01295 [Syntrophobacteraceae bacterium]|nr:hypothetical protein [Syntrophobacteraceae bacterium]